jgi:hypothetical protein
VKSDLPVSKKRTAAFAVLLVFGALALGGVWLRSEYPGLVRGSINQYRFSTMHENRNLMFLISYWLKFMQQMRQDPKTGAWNFNNTPTQGMDAFAKGQIDYHRGAFRNAAEEIQAAIASQGESEERLFWMALTNMRLAENENCLPMLLSDPMPVHEGMPDSSRMCALPVTAFHQKAQYAQSAADLFEKLLDRYDSGNRLYQWLLNFNYMTIGKFPDGVPRKYLIDSEFIRCFYGDATGATRAQFADIAFEEEAKTLGVSTFHPGRGVAVEDFDGDGYLDIVTGGSFGPVHLYKNDQGRRFIDITEQSGLAGVSQVFAIVPADYDNDGFVDLFICRPFDHYVLYRNKGNGTFEDVTRASGLLDTWDPGSLAVTWIPSFTDVNNDGKLDLFLSQWAFKLPLVTNVMARPRMDSALFIQENGKFVNRTKEYGLEPLLHDYYYIGSTFGDYDRDGYPDLFLSSPLRNSSVLLHNIGGKRFEETSLIHSTASGFTASFLDVNHDGLLDIFQAGFGDAKTAVEQVVFGEHTNDYRSGHSAIFLQTPDGKFETHEEYFDMPMSTMGATFGDINNDGCYDFYLGKGDPEPWFVLPNLMFVGRSDGTQCTGKLTNISMLYGLGNIQKGHGVVFFDFNNDGKQDLYSALGGMWPGDAWTSQMFVNKSSNSNTWIKIRLRGRKTNYYGMGATIRVRGRNAKGQEIIRYSQMDNKTGFGGAPLLAHIGMMDADKVEGIDVTWPASRCVHTYSGHLGALNMLDEAECRQEAAGH